MASWLPAWKQGDVVRIAADAGHHQLAAKLDWHSGKPVALELSDDRRTSVVIEYAWLISDSWLRPAHPFKYAIDSDLEPT